MRLPQQIMSLAKAVRKPYLAGSIICICFFLLELTAWPNMSPWSWLYLAPYCIALLLLTWFPVPASMAILVTHIACAIIPAICDGPSTLYGTWLVCGIVAFEIKRFEFAIMGPLLCALALPLGYWTGGIDYKHPCACVLLHWSILRWLCHTVEDTDRATENRPGDCTRTSSTPAEKTQRNSHTARFHRRSYDICDSAVSQERALREQRHFATD